MTDYFDFITKKPPRSTIFKVSIKIFIIWASIIFISCCLCLILTPTIKTTEHPLLQDDPPVPDPRRIRKSQPTFVEFHVSSLPIMGDVYQPGFEFIGRRLCPERGIGLRLVIIITSAPDHLKKRKEIRQTWGSIGQMKGISLGFILGTSPNETVENEVYREQDQYEDILKGTYEDNYDSLTFKVMNLYEFIYKECPLAKLVLKTDDDVFINIYKLEDTIRRITFYQMRKEAFHGNLARNLVPFRNTSSKYYISTEDYPNPLYPKFITGPAYIFPSTIAKRVFDKALIQSFFKLEDVFFTGLVASSLQIQRRNHRVFFNDRCYFSRQNLIQVLTIHPVRPGEQYVLWHHLNNDDE